MTVEHAAAIVERSRSFVGIIKAERAVPDGPFRPEAVVAILFSDAPPPLATWQRELLKQHPHFTGRELVANFGLPQPLGITRARILMRDYWRTTTKCSVPQGINWRFDRWTRRSFAYTLFGSDTRN